MNEKNKLKDKLIKLIENVFGTKGNIRIKFGFSLFISGLLFFTFSIYFKDYENVLIYKTFTYISAFLFCFWMILVSDVKTLEEFSIELFRLSVVFFSFIFSLYFCIIDCVNYNGFGLVIRIIGRCTVIVFCFFYLVSRFVDILIIIKNIVKKVKEVIYYKLMVLYGLKVHQTGYI